MNNINFKSVLKALIFSVAATVLFLLVLGVVSYFSSLSEGTLSVIIFVLTMMCLLLGGLFAAKGAGQKGLLHGAAVGVGYALLLFVCSLIENKGFEFSMHLLSLGLGCIGAAALGGIFGVNGKKCN